MYVEARCDYTYVAWDPTVGLRLDKIGFSDKKKDKIGFSKLVSIFNITERVHTVAHSVAIVCRLFHVWKRSLFRSVYV